MPADQMHCALFPPSHMRWFPLSLFFSLSLSGWRLVPPISHASSYRGAWLEDQDAGLAVGPNAPALRFLIFLLLASFFFSFAGVCPPSSNYQPASTSLQGWRGLQQRIKKKKPMQKQKKKKKFLQNESVVVCLFRGLNTPHTGSNRHPPPS